MSIFEGLMLLCFGAAWPISIYKSLKSRSCSGKSVVFLYIVLFGYAAGITHKLLYNCDWIIALYILNELMVLIDILIYYKNIGIVPKVVVEIETRQCVFHSPASSRERTGSEIGDPALLAIRHGTQDTRQQSPILRPDDEILQSQTRRLQVD